MRKLLSIFLITVISITIIFVPNVTAHEYLGNGGFESGMNNWIKNGCAGVEENIKKSGNASLMIKSEAESGYFVQTVSGVSGGDILKFITALRIENLASDGRAVVKFEFWHSTNGYIGDLVKTYTEVSRGKWQNISFDFEVPEGSDRVKVMLRMIGGGEVYYDDVSITGKDLAPLPCSSLRPAMSENIIKNGGFESVTNGAPDNFESYGKGGAWGANKYTSVESDAYKGKNSVRIYAIESGTYPTIHQKCEVTAATEYQAGVWVYAMGSDSFTFYITFHDAEDKQIGSFTPAKGSGEVLELNRWQQKAQVFTTPANAKYIRIYLRTTSDILVDELECFAVSESGYGVVSTDECFYYTDWDKGVVNFEKTLSGKSVAGGTTDFEISDNKGTVKASAYGLTGDSPVLEFKTADLNPAYGDEFTVAATLKDANGNKVFTDKQTIYYYDRPTHLNKDGVYSDAAGNELNPVFGYDVSEENYRFCVDAGINVVTIGHTIDGSKLKAQLDKLEEYGLYGLVCLYTNAYPCGYPDYVEATKKAVEEIKDHPALFGYAVQDEPSQVGDPVPWLITSYKTIRDIDRNHPVYAVESAVMYGYYKDVAKCVDIFAVDPYPANRESYITFVSKCVKLAQTAVNYRKPVYSLLQTFDWRGFFPTGEQTRHMFYQSLLAGAHAVGYYTVSGICKSVDLKEDVLNFGKNESKNAYDLFLNNKYIVINEENDDSSKVWYKIWEDELNIYALVLNRDTGSAQAASIKISGAAGEPLIAYGDASGSGAVLENGSLKVNLAVGGCVVYKMQIDGTGFEFTDLNSHLWAKEAITELNRQGIVNSTGTNTYSPGENITRADFAMFLIRTLGLKADDSVCFDDVDQNAYYAKEIAIGKKLGILRGVGGNSFDPGGEISRQDLMVICARGLRYALKLSGTEAEITSFADSQLISDYAKSDIASMVSEKIILGNADGTINPHGKATRAEAAVIMYRILRK